MGDWYNARFTAGARGPISFSFYTDRTDKEQIEVIARAMLATKTTLAADNWDMTDLDVDEDPPRRS